jgi:hypothetical protein
MPLGSGKGNVVERHDEADHLSVVMIGSALADYCWLCVGHQRQLELLVPRCS